MIKSLIERFTRPASVEVTVNAVNLVRGRTYLLVIDPKTTTKDTAVKIQKALAAKRIKSIIMCMTTPGGQVEVVDAGQDEKAEPAPTK